MAGGDHGLHSLSRHVNSEAGKAAGVVGAQLLLLITNWQRGVAEHGELLHRRLLPWRRNGSAAAPAPGADADRASARGWRLPWHRGGARGGAGDARGGERGGGGWGAAERAREWVAKGAAAERAFDLREALACYSSALALQPASLEYLCRVAKQWSDLTYEPGAGDAQAVEANTKAVEYAERAVALAPQVGSRELTASCVLWDGGAAVRVQLRTPQAVAPWVQERGGGGAPPGGGRPRAPVARPMPCLTSC
jgi:tetratricopeptide (TPR) repeat protein